MVFRFDTKVDVASGKVYAEAFFPEDADVPFASTGPIYPNHEIAEADMRVIVAKAMQGSVG